MSNRKIDAVTIDELSLMPEEDLADRINKCRSEMGKRLGDWEWKDSWEIELCYAQRELQIRQSRRRVHQEFLTKETELDRQLFLEDELLPEYDGNRIPRYVREMLEWT